MKRKKRISMVIAFMMLMSVFAVPALAYGKTTKAKVMGAEEGYEGYYISTSGQRQEYLYIDKTEHSITVKAYNGSGEQINLSQKGWKWSSDDPDIASVDANSGVITAHETGWSTDINVVDSSDNYLFYITIYVGKNYYITAESGEIDDFVAIGSNLKLTIKSIPDGTVELSKWTWESDNSSIASVDQQGNVSGVAKGYTSIYAMNNETYDRIGFDIRVGYISSYGDGFWYELYPQSGTASIMELDSDYDYPSDLTIPATTTYGGQSYAVTTIAEKAFLGATPLKAIRIPDSVTSIGKYALGYYYNGYLERYDKYPDVVIYGYSHNSAAAQYAAANGIRYINIGAKPAQTISGADSFTKAYGSKAFGLGASASNGGTLTYSSDNTKVATVDGSGTVAIKGTGKATITITAAATDVYGAAAKNVTITVTPKKVSGLKVKAGKKNMAVNWKKDTKASGYQITYAQKKNFKKGKKNVSISKNKTTKKTIKKLKAKKTYYVKVRAYKKDGGKKLYGAYSAVKKVKIK